MEEVVGSSEILHGSPRNNDLLTLLCNVIGPNCSASQSGLPSSAGSNIVVTADITEDIIQSIEPNSQPIKEGHSTTADCSCSTIEDTIDPNEEVSVTEEEIAGLGDIGPEIIESVTVASGQRDSSEELIRANNIRKTVDDINNNHLSQEIGMPQNPALVEAATMSSITSSAPGGGEFLAGSVQAALGIDTDQNNFAMQSWTLDAVNGNMAASVSCDASVLSSRETYSHAGLAAHGLPAMESGYMPQAYVSQHQFNLPRHDQALLSDQLLHNTPFPVQDYSSSLLRPESLPTSRTQDLTSLSSAHQINSYHQNSSYDPVAMLAHSQDASMSLTTAAYNFNNNARSGPETSQHSKERTDSGSEESLSEDRCREKKLTTTPIPSDAEKTSSSGSSESSGSHEESPSPRDSRVQNSLLAHSTSTGGNTYVDANYHELIPSTAHDGYGSADALLNEDGLMNAIPLPENVVEIGENSMQDYGGVEATLSNDNIPVSPKSPAPLNRSVASQRSAPTSAQPSKSKTSLVDSSDSWSVVKEERRRKKLHKKHKKSKQQETVLPSDASNIGHCADGGSERVKHYQKACEVNMTAKRSFPAGEQRSTENCNAASTYSNLLPKTTADPIGAASVVNSSDHRSITSATWGPKGKEKPLGKKSVDKLKKKRNAPSDGHQNAAESVSAREPKVEKLGWHASAQNRNIGTPATSLASQIVAPSNGVVVPSDSGCNLSKRWQTVTAVQDPKLPPMLSERDRIPKRGRPSKKMKEMNLKCKSTSEEAPAASSSAPKLTVKPSESASRTVSMYTINDKGLIEVLNNKPKENRRSKERAEAFRNMLTEISKKNSIQKKTAGAKEVVGAFKAVGVRTRKQASTGAAVDDKKKQLKAKSRAVSGKESTSPNESIKDKDGMYTFSELAKQFNISNSILYRALEQSQRSMMSKPKAPKTTNKPKQVPEKKGPKCAKTVVSRQVNKEPPAPRVTSVREAGKPAKLTKATSPVSIMKQETADAVGFQSAKAPAGVSSSQIVTTPENEVKRKKKKKKHKKDRSDGGKKRKNKDKKKKKKRDKQDRESFLPDAASERAKNPGPPSSQRHANSATERSDLNSSSVAQKASPASAMDSANSLSRPDSISSLSGPEEDNAYDGGDSSSDVEIGKSAADVVSTSVTSKSSPPPTCTIAPPVFGTGLSSSSLMPSFHGIKEHGGLVQFSEHTRKMEELRDARSKKHKHKRKKLVRRSKNISDPTFLYNMEELVAQLERTKISAVPFLSGSGLSKPSSVFACDFSGRTKLFQSGGMAFGDALSYRDPAKNRSKLKRPCYVARNPAQKSLASEQFANVSTFCRSGFFVEHGFVKPHSGKSPANLMKTMAAKTTETAVETSADHMHTQALPPPSFVSLSPSTSRPTDAPTPQQKSDASTYGKKMRKKRGWPLGKPRGPRSKKPWREEDVSTGDADPVSEATAAAEVSNDRDSAQVRRHLEIATSKAIASSHAESEERVVKSSRRLKNSLFETQGEQSQVNGIPVASTPSGNKTQISNELVDHIKAAITASFNSTTVSSDVVAKTVDSAVKDYLSRLGESGNEAGIADDKPVKQHATHVSTAVAGKKPRGRPPKRPSVAGSSTSRAGQTASLEQSKLSEKPKKFWASKHHGTSLIRSASGTSVNSNASEPQAKRGPGRPRKYPVGSSAAQRAASRAASASKFSLQGFYRNKPSNASRVRNNARMVPRRNGGRGRKLSSGALTVKTKHNIRIPPSAGNIVSGQQAKVAARSLICGKSLQQHAQSSAWLAAVSVPEPGLYEGTIIEEHINEAIDATVEAGRRSQIHDDSRRGSGLLSVDSYQKTFSKKSLENVVAKLKSKQVDGKLPENSKFHNNRSIAGDAVLRNGPQLAEKRPRGRPRKDDTGDAVPTKRFKSSKDFTTPGDQMPPDTFFRQSSDTSAVLPEEQKVFQIAGLFSPVFKGGSGDDSAGDDEDSSPLFPSPFHAGRFLRKSRKDFQLPYNIWWMYHRKLIQPRQDPATQFIKIDKNVYVDTQPTSEQEEHICVCKTLSDIRASGSSTNTEGCGKECLNRLMLIECSPDTCPCGNQCGNRAIQSNNWCPDLERFRTVDRGWGVKTNGEVAEGQFILEYVGEVVSDREFRRRTIENYNAHDDHYCIQLEAGKVIDGYRMANEGRFVNHSCMPNCEMQRWVVNGEYRLGLFAKRCIPAGEELTYDYNFHAYNLDRQQPCRCGTSECRGVIGGKTQRHYSESILNRVSKAPHDVASPSYKSSKSPQADDANRLYVTTSENDEQVGVREINSEQTPLLTAKERNFVKHHRVILLRNIDQVKRLKEKKLRLQQSDVSGRDVRDARRPEHNSKVLDCKAALVEEAIKDVFTAVMTCKDENGISVAIPFINLPSKLQNPEYYQHVSDPAELNYVEQKIMTNQYEKFDSFCSDILRVFRNAEKYHGRKSTLGRDVARLRKAFTLARTAAYAKLGEVAEKSKKKDSKVEQQEMLEQRKNSDYIRCICGIYKDEGLMIQCEKCYVWQHCDCMGVAPEDYNDERAYLCEECDERDVPVEVEVVPQPPNAPPEHTYYLTLMKDSLLVKQGDCVRIIHDHCLRQRQSNNPPVRTSYRLQSHSTPDRMDFFRIKKLWTDDNGDKFAYGHHFVRPQDTKHVDTRRFFSNELIATPFHEIVPLEAVVSVCCVMDLETYCLGKPQGAKDSDIYISQHRCNLSLRVVEKVIKTRYPIYTKPHVFHTYSSRLYPVRDYQVPEEFRKTQARRMQWLQATQHGTKSDSEDSSGAEDCGVTCIDDYDYEQDDLDEAETCGSLTEDCKIDAGKGRSEKKERLNGILSKLLKDANSRNQLEPSDASSRF